MSPFLEFTSFAALTSRHRIRARLVAVSGIRVGAGKAQDPEATDQPIMRDALGRPYLPGSAIKGALRSGLERVIRGLGQGNFRACDVLDEQGRCTSALETRAKQQRDSVSLDEVCRTVCITCGLFGSTMIGGRVFVRDLPLVPATLLRTEVRDGVGINRDLGVAQPRVKYDTEVVPPGAAFALEILLENCNSTQVALVLKTLEMLDEGVILIGGMTSRGLGRVHLEQATLGETSAQALLARGGFTETDWAEAQEIATQTLVDALAAESSPQPPSPEIS